jgi:hypothetical protein
MTGETPAPLPEQLPARSALETALRRTFSGVARLYQAQHGLPRLRGSGRCPLQTLPPNCTQLLCSFGSLPDSVSAEAVSPKRGPLKWSWQFNSEGAKARRREGRDPPGRSTNASARVPPASPKSGRGLPQSKTWRTFAATRVTRQRLGVRPRCIGTVSCPPPCARRPFLRQFYLNEKAGKARQQCGIQECKSLSLHMLRVLLPAVLPLHRMETAQKA